MNIETLRDRASLFVGCLLLGVSLIASLVAILIPNPYSSAIAISTVTGAPIALLLLRAEPPEFDTELHTISLKGTKLLLTTYALSATILFVAYIPGQSRSLLVHSAQLVLYLLCAISIVTISYHFISLTLLVLAALIHRLTLYWASAAQIGLDALFHSRIMEAIVNANSLSPLLNDKYYYAPVQHLYGAASQIILGSQSRIAGLAIVIAVVTISILGVYGLTARFSSPTIGLFGAYLFGVSDYLTNWAVQLTPTTIGIALLVLSLLTLSITTDLRDIRILLLFIIIFAVQTLTHQVSVFATAIAISAYLFGHAIYTYQANERNYMIRLTVLAGLILMTSWIVTRRNGPVGDVPPFIAEMISLLYLQIQTTAGETIYPEIGVALAGSRSLSLLQVSGFILLFITGIIGSVHAFRQRKRQAAHFAGIGAVVAAIGMMLFPAPAIGIDFFLPNRWYPFFYIPVAVLGGIALLYIIQLTTSHANGPVRQITIAVAIVLILLVPYTAVMTLTYPGSIDGVVLDDAPGAFRLTTTPQEDALYQHTASYGNEELPTAGDHVSRQLVERYYGHPSEYYQINDTTGEHVHEPPLLIIDRAYTQTNHTSYQVITNRAWRVFGPLPINRETTAVVYDAGNGDRLRYDSGGMNETIRNSEISD